ncbi:hypothetical protein IEQ34_012579 [Dendrobium chrysotoxum]|uniref:Uncharacterized protein n=1 Tax=Dendrobium chrysotoxum TaxID=161865 RepID=A0AAV7GDD0_DENCH|nr:hypothetical protein IEQ34_012579 [Dendrobium chrysotoxum]
MALTPTALPHAPWFPRSVRDKAKRPKVSSLVARDHSHAPNDSLFVSSPASCPNRRDSHAPRANERGGGEEALHERETERKARLSPRENFHPILRRKHDLNFECLHKISLKHQFQENWQQHE